jgi:hypothetical protein
MGTIPIVHGVDGILSSVNDPDMPIPDAKSRAFYEQAHRPLPEYGQTGIMMRRIPDINGYQRTLGKYITDRYLELMKAGIEALVPALLKMVVIAKSQATPEETAKILMEQLTNPKSELALEQKTNPSFSVVSSLLVQLLATNMSQFMVITQSQEVLKAYLLAETVQNKTVHPLSSEERQILNNADAAFAEALNRGMAVAQNESKAAKIAQNAMHYVNTEHRWENIVKTYIQAITKAVGLVHTPLTDEPQSPSQAA